MCVCVCVFVVCVCVNGKERKYVMWERRGGRGQSVCRVTRLGAPACNVPLHPVITPDSTRQAVSFSGTTEEYQSCQCKVVVGAVEIHYQSGKAVNSYNKKAVV